MQEVSLMSNDLVGDHRMSNGMDGCRLIVEIAELVILGKRWRLHF